jgi:hypothetical protein
MDRVPPSPRPQRRRVGLLLAVAEGASLVHTPEGEGYVSTRAHPLDRALQIALAPLGEAKRRPEATLWAEFERKRPRLLGVLLDDVAAVLRGQQAQCEAS